MKDRYDFSKGKRGRVLPPEPEPEGKTGSRFDSTRILWIASFDWRKNRGARLVIRPSSTRHFGNTSMVRRQDSKTRCAGLFVRN